MTHAYPWLAALGLACLASTAFFGRRVRPAARIAEDVDLLWA